MMDVIDGHYVPQLAKKIQDFNKAHSKPFINLKGFLVSRHEIFMKLINGSILIKTKSTVQINNVAPTTIFYTICVATNPLGRVHCGAREALSLDEINLRRISVGAFSCHVT
ncbi:hypothetical protein ACLOJK_002657 [Asimina triloba]